MKKVEVFKDSKGNLFEHEKDYILSESKIKRELIEKQFNKLKEIIDSDPKYYYQFLKSIYIRAVEENLTLDEIEEKFEKEVEIFQKEKDIKTKDYNRSGKNVDYEPYLWGNDVLPGYDVHR